MVIRKGIAAGSPIGQRAPANEVLQQFAAWLKERGYAPTTCRLRLMFIAGMMRWMEARKIPLAEFDERVISADLARRGHPTSKEVQRSLTHFPEYVRARGHPPEAARLEDTSAAARIERKYVRYLYRERGVGDATVVNYSGLVRPLVVAWFRGKRRADFAGLDAQRVTQFFLSTAPSMAERRVQLLSCAMRSFLRFLFLESETPVDLSLSVPSIRRACRSVSQRYLELGDVERVIATCDVATAHGRRNRAVLLLLARLGLR